MNTIIIARYNEDLSWVDAYQSRWDVAIIDKYDGSVPNFGREPEAFLRYIITNYQFIMFCEESSRLLFLQGNPFDHAPEIREVLNHPEKFKTPYFFGHDHESDKTGAPYHAGLPIAEVAEEIGVELPDKWVFKAGGQFMVAAQDISKHTQDDYLTYYGALMRRPLAPWCFERLWRFIFPQKGLL